MDEKLRELARGIRRLHQHAIRGSLTPHQLSAALDVTAGELERLAAEIGDV